VTTDTRIAVSPERRFAFIDESGSPHFDPSRPEEGYVVVSALISELELRTARLVIPRGKDGELIKSSGPDATDGMGAQFLMRLFAETDAQIGLITVALSDPGNRERMERMKTGINNSPFPWRSRPSITDAIRMQAAIEAFGLSLIGPRSEFSSGHIRTVFDRGSERPQFVRKVREFMRCRPLGEKLTIDDVQWLSRDEESLIMVSDWIAGSVRRDFKRGDLPLIRRILAAAKERGRLHAKEGFTAHLPTEG